MDLQVASWPDATGLTGTPWPTPAEPASVSVQRDPDAPDWWTGENTNEFLAEQGVVLG